MRQSVLRTMSYGSVKVFWLDRRKVLSLALSACERLCAENPEVRRAGVFGSIATGRAVPGSDLDILIVLAQVEGPRHLQSDPFYRYFSHIDIGTEILCATDEELAASPFFARAAHEAIWAQAG